MTKVEYEVLPMFGERLGSGKVFRDKWAAEVCFDDTLKHAEPEREYALIKWCGEQPQFLKRTRKSR